MLHHSMSKRITLSQAADCDTDILRLPNFESTLEKVRIGERHAPKKQNSGIHDSGPMQICLSIPPSDMQTQNTDEFGSAMMT